MSKNNI